MGVQGYDIFGVGGFCGGVIVLCGVVEEWENRDWNFKVGYCSLCISDLLYHK